MLFHSFASQEDRRTFGGGDFVELQYCKRNHSTTINEIVSNDRIEHWKDDSLYLCGDDMNVFYQVYGEILTGGTYANLEHGYLDCCGINYFSPAQAETIRQRLQTKQPTDYEILLHWLEQGKPYNGFYVLGV